MIKIIKGLPSSREEIFPEQSSAEDVSAIVREIMENVKHGGDAALLSYGVKFDGFCGDSLEVSADEIELAYSSVDPELIEILQSAANNIRAFHEKQKRNDYVIASDDGRVMGQRIIPLDKCGIYVPGGTASYPSTVLMNAIPAKIAGVGEIIMVTPAKGGVVPAPILAAAKIAGVDRIFKCGGAQAIAALAFGTESVPRVDKITGPGNVYVAEAKRQVYGRVAIDMIAGPSDILVIADNSAVPEYVAADMLSQAEHDKNASAVLVCESMDLAERVSREIEKQIAQLPRRDIARASIDNNGRIIVCDNIDDAVAAANIIAPEHLELAVDSPFDHLGKIKNAGSVFLGHYCPEALGDYFAGPNHTLPTSGTAKFSSPLSVEDFQKRSAFTYYTRSALSNVSDSIYKFAESEGLMAHAKSAVIRDKSDT